MYTNGQSLVQTPDSVHVTVLKDIPEEDPNLSEAWNELVLAMENREVFFTYQWALAASRSFRTRLSTLLLLMYQANALIGVAALGIDPKCPETAFFLTSSTADYCDVVSSPSNRRAVLLALLEEIKKLGVRDLVLANFPADSRTLQEFPGAARSCNFYVASRATHSCGVVQFSSQEQREMLLQTVARRNREKRGLKRLTGLGSVRVVHLTRPEQIGTSLEAIMSSQIARFLASDRVSPLLSSERRAFLRHLNGLLSQAGWLKVSQLEINEKPVAWNYGFRFGGSWFWYLPTFEMEYEHVSPGSCLLRLLVEEGAQDATLQRLDLGLGNEPYKERFANNHRQTRYVHLSREFPRHLMSMARQTASRAADRFPSFSNKLRHVRTYFRAVASRVNEAGFGEIARLSVRTLTRYLASVDEVLLFEAEGHKTESTLQLAPLTRKHLVEASILNASDPQTLDYLMRCAKRMLRQSASGFVLQDESEKPVHFLWTTSYNGFSLSEIDYALDPQPADAVMIFDCWTPAANRARSYYATAIRQAAAQLQRAGKTAWIFSGGTNVSSLRGIRKAGFAYRFSLVRQKRCGRVRVTRRDSTIAVPISSRESTVHSENSRTHEDVA